MKHHRKIHFTAIILCAVIFTGILPETVSHAAPNRRFTISQAVSLSLAKSRDYRKTKSKILMKQVKYKEAVKSIRLKKKNMSTFRWTPLLSFKFPEKATLSQEYDFMYKPLQIQSEISVLQHQLEDIKYKVKEETSNLYTQIYTYQEKITYKEQQLSALQENLKRNQAKLIMGEAKQSDVDSIASSIEKTKSSLAADMRAFERAKSDLSEMMGVDICKGYIFLNPYKEARITRENLESLIKETLSRSQSFYEAKMTTSLALTCVNTNYSLMSRQYGNKMSYISSYVNQAKKGEQIDNEAFKSAYDNFLTAIDEPWQGSIRILFIKIPKEWFKGSIDGVRYVEDDPYLLYSNVLEYQDAVSEQSSLEREITKSVEEGFENLVTAKNSYDSLKAEGDKAKKDMERAALLNKAGELSFEEYEEIEKEYEELQISVMEALELYTTLLYSYDRLTCGAVTQLLNEKESSMGQGISGESFVTEELSGEAYYYILSQVEDNIFELGIHIPDDYETEITHFELWVDKVKIGERTEVNKTLRHLTLTLDNTKQVFIRLYADDNFIADVSINPEEYEGKLEFDGRKQQGEEKQKTILGSYKYTVNKKTETITFMVIPEEGLGITSFRLTDELGTAICKKEPVLIKDSLTYLSILNSDLETITVELYGEEENLLYMGKLDTKTKEIYVYKNR
ncbi:MAG: TolC family protein [Lachnospiraceae bacterium]|nr:TolC family protein [Lachnospiraceae bacterium]